MGTKILSSIYGKKIHSISFKIKDCACPMWNPYHVMPNLYLMIRPSEDSKSWWHSEERILFFVHQLSCLYHCTLNQAYGSWRWKLKRRGLWDAQWHYLLSLSKALCFMIIYLHLFICKLISHLSQALDNLIITRTFFVIRTSWCSGPRPIYCNLYTLV